MTSMRKGMNGWNARCARSSARRGSPTRGTGVVGAGVHPGERAAGAPRDAGPLARASQEAAGGSAYATRSRGPDREVTRRRRTRVDGGGPAAGDPNAR